MFRSLLSVSGFTLLSRLTGLLRDILQAAALGAGPLSDAFVVAFTFPNYFRSIFGEGTINPAFLPRYAALKAQGQDDEAARFANAVFAWQMAAQLALLAFAFALMPFVVMLIAPGFADDPQQLQRTAHLSRITFPYLIMTVVAVQLSAMLNAIEKFAAAAAWSILLNLAMITALLAAHWFPNAAEAAAWGVFSGGLAQLVFIIWAARRDGLTLSLAWPRWSEEIGEFFKAYGAVTVGAASVLIAPLIDTMLASYLPAGSRTALYYADRINQLPLGVLGIAVGTVLLPEMSSKLAVGDEDGAFAAQNRAAALSLLLTLPFAVSFVLIPGIIMRGILAHGAFHAHAAEMAGVALAAYGVGLPAFSLVRICASTFYARHDTMTPARVTAAAIGANIALKLLLVWVFDFGIAGLALGTAFGAWINVFTLVILGQRRGLLQIRERFRRTIFPIVLSAAMTGFGALAGGQAALQIVRHGKLAGLIVLAVAMLFAAIGYISSLALFADRLPAGRLLRRRRA